MIPFLFLCDSPNHPSGLARIARDLCTRLHAESQALGIQVGMAGLRWDDSKWPWPIYVVDDELTWGRRALPFIWQIFTRGQGGILFSVWDPGRCYGTAELDLFNCRRWGYFAVDAENRTGTIGGPAADALQSYERVFGYGAWGAKVLGGAWKRGPVQWLPHGLDMGTFRPRSGQPRRVVGCVATNQPRKDLGLLFETFAILHEKDPGLLFWLHTDFQVSPSWSVPQLAEEYGFNSPDSGLTVTLPPVSDEWLAQMYSQCLVTIAPGLGEGFGYPAVESLACGTPVVQGSYGGGPEYSPLPSVDPVAYRIDGAYCLRRPVYSAGWFADVAWKYIEWMREEPAVVQGYCARAVSHLDWNILWPRWRQLFMQGLR